MDADDPIIGEFPKADDPFPDRMDCHYNGAWKSCDKETCSREQRCSRRSTGNNDGR
jgi:hypothetical protein